MLQVVETYPLRCLMRRRHTLSVNESPPLLCFLHGYDEAAPLDIFDGLTRHGPLRASNPRDWIDKLVIVAPQLPTRGDCWHRYAHVVRQIVLSEAQQHHCDLQRLYLTGFSFGGNGVFDLALAQPELWAALWAVDPTRVPTTSIRTPAWLSLGEISRYQARGFIRRLRLEPADSEPRSDRMWSDDGEDHVGTATLAYRDKRIYDWLLNKRLTRQAKGNGQSL
jgi:predicted peptidase